MPNSDNTRARVLIVDDQPLNVAVLEELLEEHDVATAYCGTEALEEFESFHPDIVLLDVMMPGMSGLEVCQEIRRREQPGQTVVVFLSAKAMPEDVQAGLAVGANDYVTKPFHHFEILSKVEDYLAAKNKA
ncbi:MAG: response regulator [Planctomycetota bacterium]